MTDGVLHQRALNLLSSRCPPGWLKPNWNTSVGHVLVAVVMELMLENDQLRREIQLPKADPDLETRARKVADQVRMSISGGDGAEDQRAIVQRAIQEEVQRAIEQEKRESRSVMELFRS